MPSKWNKPTKIEPRLNVSKLRFAFIYNQFDPTVCPLQCISEFIFGNLAKWGFKFINLHKALRCGLKITKAIPGHESNVHSLSNTKFNIKWPNEDRHVKSSKISKSFRF